MPRSFPLDFPDDQDRTEFPRQAKFRTSFSKALDDLKRELRLAGADGGACVSCNLPPARDGWPDPRAKLRNGDPGVAVYWRSAGKTHVIACDAWDRVEDNLHAIMLTIRADRGKVRWGATTMEKAMNAYLALPEPLKEEPWWEVLGVDEGTSLDVARAVYRAKARQVHPDLATEEGEKKRRGEQLARLNAAMEAAERSAGHAA